MICCRKAARLSRTRLSGLHRNSPVDRTVYGEAGGRRSRATQSGTRRFIFLLPKHPQPASPPLLTQSSICLIQAEISAAHTQSVSAAQVGLACVCVGGGCKRHTKQTCLLYGFCETASSEDLNQRRHFIPFPRPSAVTDELQHLVRARNQLGRVDANS